MNEWIELRVDGEMIAASSARADDEAGSPCVRKSASSSEIHTCDQPAYTRFRRVAFASSAARASRNLIAGRGAVAEGRANTTAARGRRRRGGRSAPAPGRRRRAGSPRTCAPPRQVLHPDGHEREHSEFGLRLPSTAQRCERGCRPALLGPSPQVRDSATPTPPPLSKRPDSWWKPDDFVFHMWRPRVVAASIFAQFHDSGSGCGSSKAHEVR